MPLPKVVKTGLKGWRSVAGKDSKIELWIKARYLNHVGRQFRKESGPGWVQYSGQHFTLVSESESLPAPRRGIVLRGGCDLPSMFTSAPLIREGIKGTIVITQVSSEGPGGHRTDQILQTLEEIPAEFTAEVLERLELGADYFRPRLFQKTFEVRGHPEFGVFPKTLVIMSIASDLTRAAYRHREHGFFVDPGGWWLNQSLDKVLTDLSAVEWFRSTFKPAGKISPADFKENLQKVIHEIRTRTGADVIIYNSLVTDPANPTHNYQLVKAAHSTRRREFAIVLSEASRESNFHIMDVDRILKLEGVEEQVDFAHFPVDRMSSIGEEAFRIMKELEVV